MLPSVFNKELTKEDKESNLSITKVSAVCPVITLHCHFRNYYTYTYMHTNVFSSCTYTYIQYTYVCMYRLISGRFVSIAFTASTFPLHFLQDLKSNLTANYATSEDEAKLRRILLAYTRYNRRVGYCQGFIILATVILRVTNNDEELCLKVGIFANSTV